MVLVDYNRVTIIKMSVNDVYTFQPLKSRIFRKNLIFIKK